MCNKHRRFKLTIVLWLGIASAQIHYSGSIHPTFMYRSDGFRQITLPFRLAEVQCSYSYSEFDFTYAAAIESRWNNVENSSIDNRELYVEWYPYWGEVKLGKQIISWGVADGNNPTDNLNPYDYYFLFSPGADRKIGVWSAALTYYWHDWAVQSVLIPEHTPNRLPFGETEFPFAPPDKPSAYYNMSNPLEIGVKFSGMAGETDLSLYVLNGHDRTFSMSHIEKTNDEDGVFNFTPNFGFGKTTMVGFDMVHYWGKYGFRGEAAWFSTHNPYKGEHYLWERKAEYIQYALEFEYPAPYDIHTMTQIIGTTVLSAEGYDDENSENIHDISATFQPGMGSPFAQLSDMALMSTASTSLLDDHLEVDVFTLINLEETGYMLGGNLIYSVLENMEAELGVSLFQGDDNPLNQFTLLEDFSHFRIGLKYSF
ncbi:MAG: hypothetical protein QGF57_00230 [Candidatus Marinimicrobia bacterium]|jgi:hypothetical protein|nr:hypothetical protein [Candidatus Neomarinimicrobiota bacterium]